MGKALESFVTSIAALEAAQHWPDVSALCRQWLAVYPNNSYHPYTNEVHKRHINALIEEGSFASAFAAYQLNRRDDKALALADGELLCCVVVRNEALRLPYFLAYYRQKAVTRFLIVDNGSTDGTLDYLLAQPDVYVWSSACSFRDANFGAAWFELLLRRYGIGHWVLIVDADELFYYPACEHISLPQLCDKLAQQAVKAYSALLLDMYSDKAIDQTHYKKGEDFLDVCPYFDRRFYHVQIPFQGPYMNQTGISGGVRRRVFGGTQGAYYLNKVPLLYYTPACVLTGGQHATSYPIEQISSDRGCVLHFKFFSSFPQYAATEAARQEHAKEALEYRRYANALAEEPALILYDSAHSVRFRDSAQLLELGIMQQQSPLASQPKPNNNRAVSSKQIPAYVNLGETWLAKGDAQKASAYYHKVIELDPHCVPAYHRLASIMQEAGRIDEALAVHEQALILTPNDFPLQLLVDDLKAQLAREHR